MRITKILLLLAMLGRVGPEVQAQGTERQRIAGIFQTLAKHYRESAGLHFLIGYRYASEDKPEVYLDSMKGELSMSGDRYRYVVDSTEFIGDKDLMVALYREDQTMYLVKPGSAKAGSNPLALLDSILLKTDSVECRLEETKDWQVITMSFRPGLSTKRTVYQIDRHTGYITKMINVVAAKEMYDPSVRSLVGGGAVYAIIETDFTGYREDAAGAAALDIHRYFKKEGKEYIPLAPYASYKIVLGNPDL